MLAVYASILLLSGNGLFSRSISLSALDITFHRSWIATIILTVIVLWTERNLLLHKKADYGWVILLGGFLCLHWISFFHSMQISSVAIGMIALYTYPIMTALMEPWFAGTSLDKTDILSTVLVFAGIFLLVPNFDWNDAGFVGVIWGLFSALTFSFRNLLQRYKFSNYSAVKSLNYQVFVCFILLLLVFEKPFPLAFTVLELNNTWLLIILGIGFTALPHTLFAFALNNLKAKSVSLIACMQPVFGVLLAFFVLGEIPAITTMVGGLIIMIAAVLETVHVHKSWNN